MASIPKPAVEAVVETIVEEAPAASTTPSLHHNPPKGSSRTFQAWVNGGDGYNRLNLAWRTSSSEGWREQPMVRQGERFVATLPAASDNLQYFITARSSDSSEAALKLGSAFSPLSL